MLTIDGGVMVAVSCCTALSFSLSVCGPFSYMWMARLWAFFKPLMYIPIVTASFVKLHLSASVLKQWMYTARDSFSHCWISRNCKVYMWISGLQSFSCNRCFVISHNLFEMMASVTSVCVSNPLISPWQALLCSHW